MKSKMLLPAILLLLTLSGCSGKTEVRDKGFINTIGIDAGEEQHAAIQLYDSDETLEGSGKTLFTAIADSERTQGKTLFAGHMELFVSSPENIYENLQTLIRNNRISPSCSIICTPGSACELVADTSGGYLSEILESSSRGGLIIKKNISSVLEDMLGTDGIAAVPVIKDNDIYMGIINNEKILGVLNHEESKGLCWLSGEIKDIYLPAQADGKTINFYIRKSSTKITAESAGSSINITAEIKINGNPVESDADINKVKENIAGQISGLCAKTIAKTVTGMKADVFGIEKSINARGISIDETWEELIPKLNFYYKIKISE
ncbi:Ger(x)C family spore germination C-terminal domain-containing protein [Porcipelethomonas sp.]|uniref:Ger(x)C family spore germination C-terminal domain-containing protein n=1 Tax=Porcipelethomonas sp. TaxID=2981675 RepID=UPI003EF2B99E